MGEDTVKTIIIGLTLTLLIGWLAMNFLTGGASEYSVSTAEITGGDKIDYVGINTSLNSANQTMVELKDTFFSWKIFTLPLTFLRSVYDFIVTPFQLIGNMAHNVLGVPSLVITIIWALLIFTFIFGLWRLFKVGD